MHVLQNAKLVIRRRNAQIIFHLRVPNFGQVGHARRAVNHFLLQLEAQHNVQAVRQLVGFDTDERWRHFVDGAVKRFKIGLRQLREGGL